MYAITRLTCLKRAHCLIFTSQEKGEKMNNSSYSRLHRSLQYNRKIHTLRRQLEDILLSAGYAPVEPGLFEDYDEFFAVNDRVDKKSAVKLHNTDLSVLVLSPDMTANVIGRLMPVWEQGAAVKLCYLGSTYRHSPAGIRGTRQIGAEYVGLGGTAAAADVINTALCLMDRTMERCLLEIGSSRFLSALMDSCGFGDREQKAALECLSSKDLPGLEDLLSQAHNRRASETLGCIFDLEGSLEEIGRRLEGLFVNDRMAAALWELKQIDQILSPGGCRILYDLSLTAKLGYYDGIVFRGYSQLCSRAVVRGGRYGAFAKEGGAPVPAIGFMADIDAILSMDGGCDMDCKEGDVWV